MQQQLAQQEAKNAQFIEQERNNRSIENMEKHAGEMEKIALKGEIDAINKSKNTTI